MIPPTGAPVGQEPGRPNFIPAPSFRHKDAGSRVCASMSGRKKHAKAAAKALEKADAAVAEAVEPYAGTPAVGAVSLLSDAGDQPPMRTLCAAVLAAGLAGPDPRLARAGLRMIAAHTLATLAKDFVKARVDRSRPRKDGDHGLKPGRKTGKEDTSFPSGHAAGAVAAARAYAREFPGHKAAAYGAAGAVALAQIPRSAHYPTDVGSGLAIGLASEALVDWLFDPALALLEGWLPAPIAERLEDAFQLSGEEAPE